MQHAEATRIPDRPHLLVDGARCPRVDNGHIVPRTYQRAWEGEGRQVGVHILGGASCEHKSTREAAVRGPYYRRTRPQHGTEIDDIEASLAYLENKATPALRQVIAGKLLTEERKAALAQLFGAQMMRGPAFFKKHEEIQKAVLNEATASDLKPQHLAAVGGDVELARRQVIEVLLEPTNRLMTMLTFVPKVAGILALMRWHVLRFDGPLLAYSDQPVVLWPMNVEQTRPPRQQILGPLTMLEIRVPISPDAAILMNWIDSSDDSRVPMKPRAAAELNAFTVAQAEREWMHQPGSEPEIAEGIFLPLSRLIDPSYDRAAGEVSGRRAHAARFNHRASKRTWVNELEVLTDVSPEAPLREAA